MPNNAEIFVVGDLNIDMANTKSQSSQALKTLGNRNQLLQLINKSTIITNKSSTIIDHIYTNSEHIKDAGVLNINVSDHLPPFTIRKKQKWEHELTTFTCRKLKYFNAEFYKEKLLEKSWDELYDTPDPNTAWTILINHIRQVLDKYYPEKTYKNVPTKAKWISNEIFKQMKYRDKLFKKAKLMHDPEVWLEAKKNNKCCSNNV